MVVRLGTETSPSSGVSSPTIIRNSVVLPAPFGPTRPTFSPEFSWKDASTNRTCLPYCLLTFEKAIMLYAAGVSRDDTLRVRVDIERIAAHESDQRDAAFAREVDRERRRRRHRGDDRHAGEDCLLDDLERRAPAHAQDV